MKYIDSLREGMRISEVYLCKSKQIAQTKAGKDYGNLVLQDKTGTIDSKIWDLGSPGICNFIFGSSLMHHCRQRGEGRRRNR